MGKKVVSAGSRTPLLCNGDHMKQPEFHWRYEASPEDFRAELIGGIVYVASPLRRPHGTYHFKLNLVLGLYEASTPGVQGGDNLTTIRADDSEPQPDLLLRIKTEYGGQSRYDKDGIRSRVEGDKRTAIRSPKRGVRRLGGPNSGTYF